MEDQQFNTTQKQAWEDWEKSRWRGKVASGILLVAFGGLMLAKHYGAMIPAWVFSWKTFLIGMGLVVGVKSLFKRPMWFILVLIGSIGLATDLLPELNLKPAFWPMVIVIIGLVMIFKPKRTYSQSRWFRWQQHHGYSHKSAMRCGEAVIDNDNNFYSDCVMSGVKKKIISKDFKGGEINNVMGGSEFDLSEADINGEAVLKINQVLGGMRLIIPSNWQLRSEVSTMVGSVDDKRVSQVKFPSHSTDKVLVLRGNSIFGGIEITSYI